MADDQELADNVRTALAGAGNVCEIRMFGGIGFMLNGNLVAAASRRGLLLRVGKDRQPEALAHSGASQIVMRGRAMEGYVYVDPPALSKQAVQNWVHLAVAHVQTLPPKAKGRTNRERENKNEDAPRTWSPRLPRAHFRARLRLAPDSVPRLLRTPCNLPQGHHHSVWFSFHADP